MNALTILQGDALAQLRTLPDESVHACVTSPPYWGLRDYKVEGQLGLEATPQEYVARMVEVFREVRRVLRKDGTAWVNMGDSYAANAGQRKSTDQRGPKQCTNRGSSDTGSRDVDGLPAKNLVGIPWRLAFALQADGWYLRQDIIWHKPNPMPESVTDRCTKAHEYVFLLSKSPRYFYDSEAVKEPNSNGAIKRFGKNHKISVDHRKHADDVSAQMNRAAKAKDFSQWIPGGRNKRSVWTVPSAPYKGAHFATFPPKLIEPCILAGCPVGGTVLDPFAGSGTTGAVALDNARFAILIELNPDYIALIHKRVQQPLTPPSK